MTWEKMNTISCAIGLIMLISCNQKASNISADTVEDYTYEHNGENISTDTVEDYINEDLMQQKGNISIDLHIMQPIESENQTLEELRSNIEGLVKPQEVGGSRTFLCSTDIKLKLLECSKQCTVLACLFRELQNYDSACTSGNMQTCQSTPCNQDQCVNGKCEDGQCKCNLGFTGPPMCKPDLCGIETNSMARTPRRSGGKPNIGRPSKPNRYMQSNSNNFQGKCGIANNAKSRRKGGSPTKGKTNKRRTLQPNSGRPSKQNRERLTKLNSERPSKPNRGRPSNPNRRRRSKPNRELSRIIGGTDVNPHRKYPWQIALLINGAFQCGGSIINSRWILTAAHCILVYNTVLYLPPEENKLTVIVGEYKRSTSSDNDPLNTRVYNVKRLVMHPDYDSMANNDFALLELTSEIPFNSVIRPVCLPEDNKNTYAGYKAIASGWGSILMGENLSDVLKELEVTISAPSDCIGWVNVPNSQLCTEPSSPTPPGTDTCGGDSGGPLVIKDGNKYIQVGITSYGGPFGCTSPTHSAVYARVTEALGWIKRTLACA